MGKGRKRVWCALGHGRDTQTIGHARHAAGQGSSLTENEMRDMPRP
jgi:hypothetical protein